MTYYSWHIRYGLGELLFGSAYGRVYVQDVRVDMCTAMPETSWYIRYGILVMAY